MTERLLLFSISALLGSIALGEPLPDAPSPTEASTEIAAPAELEPTPPELAEAIVEHDTAVKTLEQQDAEARGKLRDWYASSLETMRQDAVSQGDLDHVLALDLERQRIDLEITPEERAQLFYTLRELRARFDRERADQMRHATAAVRVGLQQYAVALDRLAGIFLQHGNVGAARVVERARLSMLGSASDLGVRDQLSLDRELDREQRVGGQFREQRFFGPDRRGETDRRGIEQRSGEGKRDCGHSAGGGHLQGQAPGRLGEKRGCQERAQGDQCVGALQHEGGERDHQKDGAIVLGQERAGSLERGRDAILGLQRPGERRRARCDRPRGAVSDSAL